VQHGGKTKNKEVINKEERKKDNREKWKVEMKYAIKWGKKWHEASDNFNREKQPRELDWVQQPEEERGVIGPARLLHVPPTPSRTPHVERRTSLRDYFAVGLQNPASHSERNMAPVHLQANF